MFWSQMIEIKDKSKLSLKSDLIYIDIHEV